jgi:GNAT superfamily N-acetyltransferase
VQVSIRPARPDELEWVNERYREVDFVRSAPEDLVAIAEVDGVRAGLARVLALEGAGELGGMYVLDAFRGRGVAQALIRHLLANTRGQLYCLPFESLEPLYAASGFRRVMSEAVPEEIAKKHRWCNEHYTEPVLLLVLDR